MTILKLADLQHAADSRLTEGYEKIAKSLADTQQPRRWRAFLSYRSLDQRQAFAAAERIKDVVPGLSIYVDSEDPGLAGTITSTRTAERLREQIRDSDLLIVAVTSESPDSRWIPWELGLADGIRKRAAILPCDGSQPSGGDGLEFRGQEYLGLYPWLDLHQDTGGTDKAWANTLRDTYMVFEAWMEGKDPTPRTELARLKAVIKDLRDVLSD